MNNSVFEKGKKFGLKASVDYSEGAIVSKIVAKKDAGNVTLFAFDKGQNLSEHTAPFDALIQIVEGEAKIWINKVEFTLVEGEIINMPADIPHAVEASEKFKMLLTMLKTKV